MRGVKTREIEWAVEEANSSEDVVIRRNQDQITVRWGCQSPTFVDVGLRDIISAIEALTPFPDVWLKLPGRDLYVRLDGDGQLHAGTSPNDDRQAPWKPLRKALRRACEVAS